MLILWEEEEEEERFWAEYWNKQFGDQKLNEYFDKFDPQPILGCWFQIWEQIWA
jgi:hypothetical protein